MAEHTHDNEIYDNHGKIEFGGAGNAYTARTARAIAGYFKGLRICGKANHSNTGPATLNVNAIGGFSIRLPGNDPLAGGEILSGGYYDFLYDATNGVFQIQNPSGTTVTTAQLADNSVTYAKMQNVSATARILGRKTAGAGDPEECTLSEVLDFIGSAAQGDILYRGASGWARLGAGTSGWFLKTQGTGANPTWDAAAGVVLLTSGTVSSAATLDIALTGYTGYRGMLVKLYGFLPATDGASLWCRFSTDGGSNFDATGYNYAVNACSDAGVTFNAASNSANQIVMAFTLGSAANEGANATLEVLNQTNTAFWSRVMFQAYIIDNSGTPAANHYVGGGSRETAQDTDALRILPSTGNIASCTYAVYGYL